MDEILMETRALHLEENGQKYETREKRGENSDDEIEPDMGAQNEDDLQ